MNLVLIEEDYKDAIRFIEYYSMHGTLMPELKEYTSERAARLYVALLKVSGNDFPQRKQVSRYLYTLDDDTYFVNVYLIAAKGGISISTLRKLYDSSKMPDMIYTTVRRNDEDVKDDSVEIEIMKDISERTMASTIKDILPEATCSKLSNTAMLSNAGKRYRKQGAIIFSYSIVFNGYQAVVNRIKLKDKVYYDINSYHCGNVYDFAKELLTRLKNKSGR
jgi:hypothetical protein